ncbi:MAG: hypothetical protein V4542_04400 [Pseudomonadota bacterium]
MKANLATRLKKTFRWGAIAVIAIGYPVLSHIVSSSSVPSIAGAFLAIAPLMGLALLMAWRSRQRAALLALCLAGLALLYAGRDWLVSHYNWVFLLQHAGTYGLLCLGFGRSLRKGHTPMISRFAAMVHPEMSPAQVSYTRSATWAWTLYFASISGISLLLFWLAPIQAWSTFANLLGMPLLAMMFIAEYAVRCRTLAPSERAGPIESIRAYRRASASGAMHQR